MTSVQQHLQHLMQAESKIAQTLQELPGDAFEKMEMHWNLVLRWNARSNLTSIQDAQEAACLHYWDSLAAVALLGNGPIVDFGSGAGFPGMVLAIACPGVAFTLVEPRRKRASFLQAAKLRLGLENVKVLQARIEDTPDKSYAQAVTRATFSALEDLHKAQCWLQPGGALLAFRGPNNPQSTAAIQPKVHTYPIAGHQHRIDVWQFAEARRKN